MKAFKPVQHLNPSMSVVGALARLFALLFELVSIVARLAIQNTHPCVQLSGRRRQQDQHQHQHRHQQPQPRRQKLASSAQVSKRALCNTDLHQMARLAAGACLLAVFLMSCSSEAASANRAQMHQLSRQTNQFFLNEFCDLESKTLRSAKKHKQAPDTHSLFLAAKNSHSSVRVLPQRQQIPSSISFGFGSSAAAAGQPDKPIVKQLNCSIIVIAPKSHGLLVTVNSIGLPRNLTRLGITLNHNTTHARTMSLENQPTSANYLLTQPQSSSIAINLLSLKPIDWSHVSFDILFTVYKKVNTTTGGCPNQNWFDCGDNICVPASLVCDNNRNCPSGNDEMIFYRCYSPLFWSIAASTGLALTLVALMAIVILAVRARRAKRLIKQNTYNSNNQLAEDMQSEAGDLATSKLDLHAPAGQQRGVGRTNGSYLASNLYLGFENPAWQTTATLSKSLPASSIGSLAAAASSSVVAAGGEPVVASAPPEHREQVQHQQQQYRSLFDTPRRPLERN